MPGPARNRLTDGRTRENHLIRGPLGAYSKAIVSARGLDGRTKEGRLLSATRRALAEHLGGETNLSAPQRALIERCAMLQLRIAALDARIIDGTFTEYDSKVYLAFSNSLTRTLTALGVQPAIAQPTDPMERLHRHLASRQGAAARSPSRSTPPRRLRSKLPAHARRSNAAVLGRLSGLSMNTEPPPTAPSRFGVAGAVAIIPTPSAARRGRPG